MDSRCRRAAVTMLLAVCLGLPLAARQGVEEALEARIARIEQGLLSGSSSPGQAAPLAGRLADRMRFYATPGVSVAVINGGVIEWARGYGVVEAGGSTPVTPHTRFQAASISKSVAALGAVLLARQGRVSLDEPVNARLTSWKVPDNAFTASAPVTLRRLLSHTAGLTVSGFPGYAAGAPVPTLLQVLDGARPANSDPIRVNVRPGSVNRYSGGGYTVAQQLMIDATGKPFPALMTELVLGPLGMRDSTYEQPLPTYLRGQAATGHGTNGKPIPGRYRTHPEMAAAGLWTTPSDLAAYAIELQRALAGRSSVIPPDVAREMATDVLGNYGLGLSLAGSAQDARFGHGGSNKGFRCRMVAFVSGGRGAVVMTNGDDGSRLVEELLRSIMREYGWTAGTPREP
jgi:CubicO group peptidase (beta-lactamase class C family)